MTPTERSARPAFVTPELAGLVLVAFTVRLAVHYLLPNSIYPDAIFQVAEPAHRLAFGSGLMSWEWEVGIRSWLLPGLFAGLMRIGYLMGDAPWLINLPVALFMAAFSCAAVVCAYGWGRDAAGRIGGFVAGGFCAIWIDLVYMSNQPLTEVVAANCLIVGLYLGYAGAGMSPVSRRRLFWVGIMLGLTFALRFHLAPALAVAALGICGIRQGWRPWLDLFAGAAIPVLALALIDWATLGLPLQSVWLNFWLNVVVGVSREAGVSPFATLLLLLPQIWGPAGFILIIAAVAFAARRLQLLLWVALAIFLTHSLIAHKEYRFIYPALPLIAALAGVGLARMLQLALARRPAHGAVRMAISGGVVLTYSALSLAIAASDTFSIPWTRARSEILAFAAISRDPEICGVGIYEMEWTLTGGHTALPPAVTLYETNARRLRTESAAYNALFVKQDQSVPDPEYRRGQCFSGDIDPTGRAHRTDCVWKRPGRCTASAAPRPEPIWHFPAAKPYAPQIRRFP